jgi:hypothetical protein
MNPNKIDIHNIFSRYRKHIIIGATVLTTTLIVAVVGAGYAVYKIASFGGEKIKTLQPGISETVSDIPVQASGFIEETVLIVASGWLQQQAASPEFTQVKLGLSCFDALGGPSPTRIVEHVQKSVTDSALNRQLQDLNEKIGSGAASTTGPAACANWILNS